MNGAVVVSPDKGKEISGLSSGAADMVVYPRRSQLGLSLVERREFGRRRSREGFMS